MKLILKLMMVCLLITCARAEDLEVFLKRAAVMDVTEEDFSPGFLAVITGDERMNLNRFELLKLAKDIKDDGIKTEIKSFSIVSKTEGPTGPDKSILISVVTKMEASQSIGRFVSNTTTTAHEVVMRKADGSLVYLYSVALQVNK